MKHEGRVLGTLVEAISRVLRARERVISHTKDGIGAIKHCSHAL
jgi:hypothetical protein